ncbi:uncharacterized protein LOC144356779, partial [Saccoglossus kowalevskii]
EIEETLEKLFALTKKIDFDPKALDNLLGIKSDKVLEILKEAGLNSLGSAAKENITKVVFVIITLVCVKNIFPDWFDINSFEPSKKMPASLSLRVKNILHASKLIEKKYPSVYSHLELGSSWVNVAQKMLKCAVIMV